MVIVENTAHFHIEEPTVISIGKFDGIHKGHLEIIREMAAFRKTGLKTVIVTFSVPPVSVIAGSQKQDSAKVLTTNREKRKLFSELGIDYYVELPFDQTMMAMSATQFVTDILLTDLKMRAIVCGKDCRFGHKGAGDAAFLKQAGQEMDFAVRIVDDVYHNGEKISSSLIRRELLRGRVENANAMLMQPYLFYGEVVHGNRIGRTLGMPTVNLLPEEEKLIPPYGVYYSRVLHMGQEYDSITNLGCKPTVNGEQQKVGIESYLYYFSDEIYGDFLYVSLLHFVRPEKRFDSIEELKAQMQQDIAAGEKWFREEIC